MDGLAGMSFSEWMTALEWIAAALGVINVSLLVFRNVWNFASGSARSDLHLGFLRNRFTPRAAYRCSSCSAAWGWWLWLKGRRGHRVPVRWLDWQSRAVWLAVTAALSLNLGWVMHSYTNAVLPYADPGIAGASVAAQILLGYRRIENWVLWIVIDVAAVLLYIDRGLYPTAGLYGGMLVMSLFGLKEWVEAWRSEQRAAA